MALLLALAVAATVLMAQPGQLACAARPSPAAAEAFWRAALPDSPMPDAILELLHHRETDVANGVDEDSDSEPTPPMNFNYDDYRALPHSRPAPDLVYDGGLDRNAASGHGSAPAPDLVYDGGLVRNAASGHGSAPAPDLVYDGGLVRNAASGHGSAPAPDLVYDGGLVRNAASGDDSAAAPSSTLFFLEDAVRAGESLPFHSTDLAGATAEGPPLKLYTVGSVRAVDGSSFVVCRRGASKAAVYGCRATGPARAYILTLQAGGERDVGAATTAAAVCRTVTSPRDPEHAALHLLGVKPGGGVAAVVCHAVPDAQVLPVAVVPAKKNPSAN